MRLPHRPAKSQATDGASGGGDDYQPQLEQLGTQIESVQDFWRYNNNTPVDQIKMRESLYLFKSGFKPIWEDRRNLDGGSWTFRVPKASGPDFWTRIQLLAIGEQLQAALDDSMLPPRPLLCFPPLLRVIAHLLTPRFPFPQATSSAASASPSASTPTSSPSGTATPPSRSPSTASSPAS